jgi:hypothetical protein
MFNVLLMVKCTRVFIKLHFKTCWEYSGDFYTKSGLLRGFFQFGSATLVFKILNSISRSNLTWLKNYIKQLSLYTLSQKIWKISWHLCKFKRFPQMYGNSFYRFFSWSIVGNWSWLVRVWVFQNEGCPFHPLSCQWVTYCAFSGNTLWDYRF